MSFHHSLKASFVSLPPETDLIALDNIENDFRLSQYRPRKSGALLAIGSERGWSDRERRLLKESGFAFAGLGSRILRTETACISAASLVLASFGLM